MSSLYCASCNAIKASDEFHKNSKIERGRDYHCKICKNSRKAKWIEKNKDRHCKTARDWNKNNPDKVWSNNLFNKFRIRSDQYQEMLKNQEFSCAICKTPQSDLNQRLAVDHCHSTGKVRGLLCSNCNSGLGQFMDSITLLEMAIKYLN